MDTVRLGVIGCGGMGRADAIGFARNVPEAEIVALAEPESNNLARFLGDVFSDGKQPEATFADYREMLDKVSLDGVIIATPHSQHFPQAMDAISAGCHCLIEKPMVIRTQDALELITHSESHQKVISVGFRGPFTREFQFIRDVISRGDLGDISLITGVCAQPWIKGAAGTWRARPELSGGGNLYDSGAHMFNAMLYLTGLAATDVFAFVDNKGEQVDIAASVAMRFTKGTVGTGAVTGDARAFEQGIYIQGTRGSIKCSIYGGGRLEQWDGSDLVKYPAVPEVPSVQQNFVDCVLGRDTTPSPALLGLRQARLMDAIYESGRTGAAVQVVADEE